MLELNMEMNASVATQVESFRLRIYDLWHNVLGIVRVIVRTSVEPCTELISTLLIPPYLSLEYEIHFIGYIVWPIRYDQYHLSYPIHIPNNKLGSPLSSPLLSAFIF